MHYSAFCFRFYFMSIVKSWKKWIILHSVLDFIVYVLSILEIFTVNNKYTMFITIQGRSCRVIEVKNKTLRKCSFLAPLIFFCFFRMWWWRNSIFNRSFIIWNGESVFCSIKYLTKSHEYKCWMVLRGQTWKLDITEIYMV